MSFNTDMSFAADISTTLENSRYGVLHLVLMAVDSDIVKCERVFTSW